MKFKEEFDFREFYSDRDDYYWDELTNLIKQNNISIDVVLKNYMAFIQRRDLPQLLAYYELFKKVRKLPGSIAEVGIFIGNGLFTWTKLMETFFPGNRGKKVFGFDNFSGYDESVSDCDTKAIEYIKNIAGEFKADYRLVSTLEKLHNMDLMIPGIERVHIYNGDLSDTIPQFKTENSGVRLNLLLVDVNLYKPTKMALNAFYDLLVPGGIIALRGYGVKPWEGECLALDEFMKENNLHELKSFDFSMYPSVYLEKKY